jgi:hypothetical protein
VRERLRERMSTVGSEGRQYAGRTVTWFPISMFLKGSERVIVSKVVKSWTKESTSAVSLPRVLLIKKYRPIMRG